MPRVEWHSPLAQQDAQRRALVHALQVGDALSCWARITVHASCQSVTPNADRPSPSSTGTTELVRLLTIRDGLYLFISTGVNAYTLQRDMYLLHCEEFYVHWVGEGVNMNDCVIYGHSMEDDFMNMNDHKESE